MNKKIYNLMIFFVLLAILFNIVAGKVYAAVISDTQKSPNSLLRIFYFRDNQKARASLVQHPHSIDVLAPQTYAINNSGLLEGNIDPGILSFAQKNNIKVMPLITNKSFNRDTADAILDNQALQDIAINALVTEAIQQKYWGWQIDFEGMDASYKDRYTAFIGRMSKALKTHNLTLSVAVVAQISGNPADYPNDLWNKVIGVYDYGPLAESADFISVMSYDDPNSTGPIAEYSWLKQVADYSLKFIPAEKISLGIPLYFWKWNETSGKLVDVGGYSGVQKVLMRPHTVGYSVTEQAPFIKYTLKKNHYTVWYENAKSITNKVNLIRRDKLMGFSAWVLGLETPGIFSAVNY
jgi:spore germination protein YaaH